jgi:hypothetical protein
MYRTGQSSADTGLVMKTDDGNHLTIQQNYFSVNAFPSPVSVYAPYRIYVQETMPTGIIPKGSIWINTS